jgi:hypothetical protein
MIAKIILGAFGVIVIIALVRALIAGKIEFNAAGGGMSASRSKEPGAFWVIFALGVLVIAYIGWLLIP